MLIQSPDAILARCMGQIDGICIQRYNVRNKCGGTLFRGRCKAILLDNESYHLELVRYDHCNPLRAGLVNQIG